MTKTILFARVSSAFVFQEVKISLLELNILTEDSDLPTETEQILGPMLKHCLANLSRGTYPFGNVLKFSNLRYRGKEYVKE